MSIQKKIAWKALILLLVLVLVIPVLAACDDDDDDDEEMTSATTNQPTATQPAETEPTADVSTEPVKIGVLCAYSGAGAMTGVYVADRMVKMAELKLEEQGGVLGGRPVECIKCDTETQVAAGQACWNKLAQQEKVSAIVFGGATVAVCGSNPEMSDQFKVPVFTWCSNPGQQDGHPYVIHPDLDRETWILADTEKLVVDYLGAKRVGIIADDDEITRNDVMGPVVDLLEDLGIEVVTQQYLPYGTSDYSPFLTKIKSANPDVLIAHMAAMEPHLSVFKQMTALGGWGDITYVSYGEASNHPNIINDPSATGSYHVATWLSTLTDPASLEMNALYKDVFDEDMPNVLSRGFWILWTAIEAIEQAGTDDPQKIAEYARSGDLAWEAPGGTLHIMPNGDAEPVGGFGHFVFEIVAPGETEQVHY